MAKKKKTKKKGFFIVQKNGFLLVISCIMLFFGLAYFLKLTPLNKPFCANSISCIKDLSGNYEPNQEAIFNGQKVDQPEYLAALPQNTQVLGETSEKKHIYVDLTNQKLYAYQGGTLVYEFTVATGKWHPTPTGDFKIWVKLLRTRMSGGEGADYYDLPNVPYVMFFYNDQVAKSEGFSIHGAYWHNNFGYPMSHGCVNMRPEDAEKIYDWADPATQGNTTYATNENPGTVITIYGEPPK